MAADLHCHTKISDGAVSIEELIMLAKGSKIDTISVTDHDTLAGATRAKVIGERQGVKVIVGIELSTIDDSRGRKAHVLGYMPESPDRLEVLCRRSAEQRKRAALIMMQRVMRQYPITPEMVIRRAQGSTSIYKQHIMHALIDAGYADSFYGELYEELFAERKGTAYVDITYPEIYECIDLLRSAGALAVLAHPAVYDSYDLLEELTEKNMLDGVEVWHPRNNEGDEEMLSDFAVAHGLLRTGGTDFHGSYGAKTIPLGSIVTPEEQLKEFLSAKDRKKRVK